MFQCNYLQLYLTRFDLEIELKVKIHEKVDKMPLEWPYKVRPVKITTLQNYIYFYSKLSIDTTHGEA